MCAETPPPDAGRRDAARSPFPATGGTGAAAAARALGEIEIDDQLAAELATLAG